MKRQRAENPLAQGHNISRYWRERHIPGLSLMRAEFTAHDYAPHIHDAFVIAMTERGGSRVSSRGVIESIHPGVLFVSNPAETQSSWMNGTEVWCYRSFYLDNAGIEDMARTLSIRSVPYFSRNFFVDAALTRALLRLHELLEHGGDAFAEREAFIRTFAELFRRHGNGGGRIETGPRDRTTLRRVTAIMRERYMETLRLDDLAGAVGLTPFRLIGLFKRTAGITPHAYLTQVRLDAARALLQQRHGLAETAAGCGFYDQSALNRHFKRCYGMTPRQFARSVRPAIFAKRTGSLEGEIMAADSGHLAGGIADDHP